MAPVNAPIASADRKTPMTIDLFKAIALHRQGHLAEAAPVYEAALRLSPRDPRVLYHIGLCRLETGELAAGARHMRTLLKLEPRNAAAHHALGKALVLMGSPAAGRRHFETALENDPGLVNTILLEGSEKARDAARETLEDVRAAIGLSHL